MKLWQYDKAVTLESVNPDIPIWDQNLCRFQSGEFPSNTNYNCFLSAIAIYTLLRINCIATVFLLMLAVPKAHNQIQAEIRSIPRD